MSTPIDAISIDETVEPCVLASKVLANHSGGVCLIVHDKNRMHNHSTHWFDNIDTREVINTAIEVTHKAKMKGYIWSFFVTKTYNSETHTVICQDTTDSFNKSIEDAIRLQELI